MHIILVELSKLKYGSDFERVCVQIYGGTFNDASDPDVTNFDYPMDDGILRLTPERTSPDTLCAAGVWTARRTTL